VTKRFETHKELRRDKLKLGVQKRVMEDTKGRVQHICVM